MDVYRATSDYVPPQGCVGVIPLKEGDFFEVLESEDYRYHKDWWGVRRTGDNAIGYVPAQFIKVSACSVNSDDLTVGFSLALFSVFESNAINHVHYC